MHKKREEESGLIDLNEGEENKVARATTDSYEH